MFTKKVKSNKKYIPIPPDYYLWIQERLPNRIEKNHLYGLYIGENNTIYGDQDRTNEKALLFQGNSEEEVKLWLLEEAAREIGLSLELRHRRQEQLKWRYVWNEKETTPGHIVLKEHSSYKYDAEYDSRKWWMEYILKCLKPVCDESYYKKLVEKYLSLMNLWFDKPHWTYDYKNEEFIEVK